MGTTTTKETIDVNLVMKKSSCSDAGDVETGNKIANNESKSASLNANDKIDPDATRPSAVGRISSYVPRKSEVDKAIYKIQEIRYGKYIIAWRVLPFRMGAALLVEFAIGFLAILTAKGDLQVLPTSVSILYLFYLFSSSKAQNTAQNTVKIYTVITFVCSTCTDLWNDGCFYLYMIIYTPIVLVISTILDLVNIRMGDEIYPMLLMGLPNLSFAAADLITIIASINYASRATELSIAVPLLVSFDFLTKFSTQILDSIEVSDEECERAVQSYYDRGERTYNVPCLSSFCTGFCDGPCLSRFCVALLVVGIAITGVVLAILSIGIN